MTVIVVGEDSDPDRRIRKEWGESLSEHMASHGFTRKALRQRLADKGVEVSDQAIGYWLNGETAPRPYVQSVLGAIFKVPPRRLFPLNAASESGQVA